MTDQAEEELLPCPWCGREKIGQSAWEDTNRKHCFCINCEARGPGRASFRGAIKAWNTRHKPKEGE